MAGTAGLQAAADAAASRGALVDRTCAAFVARMLAYAAEGAPSAPAVTADAILAVAAAPGSASAATVRLQAAFDGVFFTSHRALEGRRHALRRRVVDLAAAIAEATAPAQRSAQLVVAAATMGRSIETPNRATAGATPAVLQTLEGVHRLMLDYCGAACAADPAAAGVRPAAAAGPSTAAGAGQAQASAASAGATAGLLGYLAAVQSEMAAALESVFPRAQLQQFAEAGAPDQEEQMAECALLVLGIRLYNWEAKKGGAGLEDTPQAALGEAQALLKELESVAAQTSVACAGYLDALRAAHAGVLPASAADLRRWPLELANRRQIVAHASTLAEEVRGLALQAEQRLAEFADELRELKRVTSAAGSGASRVVSKEAVYPRFRGLAEAWLGSANLRGDVAACGDVLAAMRPYVAAGAAHCSLSPEAVRVAHLAAAAGTVPQIAPLQAPAAAAAADLAAAAPADAPAAESGAAATAAATEIGTVSSAAASVAERLSLPSEGYTPLELSGFCPVSLATPADPAARASAATDASVSMGVLQHGNFDLGLAVWRGRFYVCSSEAAMAAFVARPAFYLARVRRLAIQHFELVHLLQAFERPSPAEEADAELRASLPAFPYAALNVLVQFGGDLAAAAASIDASPPSDLLAAAAPPPQAAAVAAAGPPLRVGRKGTAVADAAVETPVHFVERHIDPRYEFSEWALRRRALQLANLRKCATHGVQTDGSHFRRDNDTQVYLPREATTQTLHSISANTERTVSYISGVRGVPEPVVETAARNRAAGRPSLPSSSHRVGDRHVPSATQVDNVIDECEDPGRFRERLVSASVSSGAQTS